MARWHSSATTTMHNDLMHSTIIEAYISQQHTCASNVAAPVSVSSSLAASTARWRSDAAVDCCLRSFASLLVYSRSFSSNLVCPSLAKASALCASRSCFSTCASFVRRVASRPRACSASRRIALSIAFICSSTSCKRSPTTTAAGLPPPWPSPSPKSDRVPWTTGEI